MKKTASDILFALFLDREDRNRDGRAINRKLAFHEMIDGLGGEWVENDYQFTERERILVREAIKEAEATYSKEAEQKLKEETNLLHQFSRIVVESKGIRAELLTDEEEIDFPTLKRLKQISEAKHRDQVNSIIEAWERDIDELDDSSPELIGGRLLSKILYLVDKALNKGFIEDMEKLIDLPFTQKGEIEVFLEGTPEIDEFVSYVKENNQLIKKMAFGRFGHEGWNNALPHFLRHIAKLMDWDYKFIAKEKGIVERYKKVIAQCERQKFKDIPKDKTAQKEWAIEFVRMKRKSGGRLTTIEQDLFRSMTSRAILSRREIISNNTFHRILDFRVNRHLESREA